MILFRRAWYRVLTLWWQTTVPMRLRALGVKVGSGTRFFGMPIVSMAPNSSIVIGSRVVLCSDSRFTALGVNHPVILRTIRRDAAIHIGDDTGISGGSICAARRVHIGQRCLLGANVYVVDTDFHAIAVENRRYNVNEADISAGAIEIGDDVFIGAKCVVLKGSSIGAGSVVGANSTVTKAVASDVIVAGTPARVIGSVQEACRGRHPGKQFAGTST